MVNAFFFLCVWFVSGFFLHVYMQKCYFVSKIVQTLFEKKNSSDWEQFLELEAEGREFVKNLRLLEKVILTAKGQYILFLKHNDF